MSMDAIKQVADSEQQAKERLAQAQLEAKALVEQAKKAAQDQARALLAQAETLGGEKPRQILAEYETDCQALKERSRARLDKAAEVIVGKVVRG